MIYASHHKESPAIRSHSLLHGCAGWADSLDEARRSFRSEITNLFGVGPHELALVVEHLEVDVAGLWVRDKIGAVRRDAVGDRMLLQALISDGTVRTALGAHMKRATSCGARAVAVADNVGLHTTLGRAINADSQRF